VAIHIEGDTEKIKRASRYLSQIYSTFIKFTTEYKDETGYRI